jgi:hypothetical protein
LEILKETKIKEIERLNIEIKNYHNKIEYSSKDRETELYKNILNSSILTFKNKKKIALDIGTGILWPNPDYFDLNTCIKIENLEISGIKNWTIASYDEALYLLQKKCKLWGEGKHENFIKNYSHWAINLNNNDSIALVRKPNNNGPLSKQAKFTCDPFLPCNKQFTCLKLGLPKIDENNINNIIQKEMIRNKINTFVDSLISHDWTPDFESNELNDIFEKIYLKEKLIIRLNDLNEKIETSITPLPGIYGLIDFEKRLYGLNISKIDSSPIKYCDKCKEYLDSFFQGLDEYCKQKEELISNASKITNLLKKPLNISNEFSKKERDVYILRHKFIQQRLDFTFDLIYRSLRAFRDEISVIGNEISNIAFEGGKLSALHALENKQRPSFLTFAEYTSQIISKHINRFEWYEKNSDLINKIVKIFNDSFKNYDIFVTKKKQDFLSKCLNESIEESISNEWFEEWRTEKIIFEEKLTSIITAAIDQKLEPTCTIKIANELTSYSLIIDEFFENERIGIHQKYAFQHCGDLHEKFEKESELSKRYDKFHLTLQESIFMLAEIEQRILVTQWAEQWLKDKVPILISFIKNKDTETAFKISQTTLEEFSKLKDATLESFILDINEYTKAREQISREYNSLMYKMRKELSAKEK